MISPYEISLDELRVNNKVIKFPYEIVKVIHFDDGYCVLLHTNTKKCRDNVFFINADGTIRWQIEPFAYVEKPKYTGYTNIWAKDDELHVFMFDGFDCHIDPKTGKILSRDFVK